MGSEPEEGELSENPKKARRTNPMPKIKKTGVVAALVCFLMLAATGLTAAQNPPSRADQGTKVAITGVVEVTMTGMVVDTHCYICHGKKGSAHRMCGQSCASAGVPLAFLSDKGLLYYAVSSTPGQNQNPKLQPYVDQRVKVTGKIFRRAGARAIEIRSIQGAQ
jgi:mono/diheme cytochrome c family protein